MAIKKKAPDWLMIKSEYLSDTCSIRDLAERYGISDTAIRARAKAESWPPRPKKVRTALEREPVLRTSLPTLPLDRANAQPVDAGAIADHGRALVDRMLDELDTVTTHAGELEEMIEAETAGDENGRRRDGMLGAISLGGRAKTLKELATAFKTLNEAAAPQGKKAAAQDKADAVASRFRPIGPPRLKSVQ